MTHNLISLANLIHLTINILTTAATHTKRTLPHLSPAPIRHSAPPAHCTYQTSALTSRPRSHRNIDTEFEWAPWPLIFFYRGDRIGAVDRRLYTAFLNRHHYRSLLLLNTYLFKMVHHHKCSYFFVTLADISNLSWRCDTSTWLFKMVRRPITLFETSIGVSLTVNNLFQRYDTTRGYRTDPTNAAAQHAHRTSKAPHQNETGEKIRKRTLHARSKGQRPSK